MYVTIYVDNCFLKNDKDHFTPRHRAEIQAKYATPMPAPKPAKKRSGGSKTIIYDLKDMHNYDDPKDYRYDHEDKFDDFKDAWDCPEDNYQVYLNMEVSGKWEGRE